MQRVGRAVPTLVDYCVVLVVGKEGARGKENSKIGERKKKKAEGM